MKISPNYTNDDWNNLNLSKNFTQNWLDGADIVYDRIHGRYLAQIESLENNLDLKIWEFSGFMIMAIDCMVIETLNQFYLGISDTNKIYNKRNKDSFKEFFEKSVYFRNHFDEETSYLFYNHVRNGLIHQAQTKRRTKINIRENEMIKQVNKENLNEGIIVNRRIFHQALVNEFNSYICKLKTNNSSFNKLRAKCIDKMKIICK